MSKQLMIDCYIEAVKCHHNNIAEYIKNNLIDEEVDISKESIEFYNFQFINENLLSTIDIEFYIQNNHSFLIDKIFENKNAFDYKSYDLLCFAIRNEKLEAVKHLLSNYDIDINNPTKWYSKIKSTPLIYAIQKENPDIVKYLLSLEKTNVNIRYYDFDEFSCFTALNCAIQTENIDIVQLLLEREDIDVNKKDKRYDIFRVNRVGYYYDVCPLYNSIYMNNIEILKLLGAHKNIDLNAKFLRYREECIKDKFKYYRIYKTPGYEQYYGTEYYEYSFHEEKSVLYFAVELGRLEIVKYLLTLPEIDKSVNCIVSSYSSKEKTIKNVFDIAFEKQYYQIFKVLLEQIDDRSIIQSCKTPFLAIATSLKNIDLINTILSCKNVNANHHYDGESALHIATKMQNIDLVKLLLSYDNVDINNRNSKNETALHIAVELQNMEIIRFLLSYENINVDVIQYEKHPIIIATEKGNLQIIQELSKHKNINVNSRYDNKTALHVAIEIQNMEIVDYLFSIDNIDVSVMCNEKPPLIIAIENNNVEIVRKLLSYNDLDINVRYYRKTALHVAVEKQNIQIVELLLAKNNIDLTVVKNEKPPIIIAVENENIKIIELLLSHDDLDVNSIYSYEKKDHMNNTVYVEKNALYISVEKKNTEIVKALLKNEYHIIDTKFKYFNERKNYFEGTKSPLDLARYIGHKEIIILLEKYYHDHENKTNENYTEPTNLQTSEDSSCKPKIIDKRPQLIIAVLSENIQKVQELCESNDVDVNVIYNNKSSLIISVEKGNIDIVKLLLSRDDIDVNYRYENKTALHIAVEMQNIQIVELLLAKNNIDLTVVKNEKPPIIIAVENENIKIIELLLSHDDLDVNSIYSYEKKDHMNNTVYVEKNALYISVEKKNIEMVNALLMRKNLDIEHKFRFFSRKNYFEGKKSPLDLAKYICHKEITKILENYKKDQDNK